MGSGIGVLVGCRVIVGLGKGVCEGMGVVVFGMDVIVELTWAVGMLLDAVSVSKPENGKQAVNPNNKTIHTK
jgi:hypothetical protein